MNSSSGHTLNTQWHVFPKLTLPLRSSNWTIWLIKIRCDCIPRVHSHHRYSLPVSFCCVKVCMHNAFGLWANDLKQAVGLMLWRQKADFFFFFLCSQQSHPLCSDLDFRANKAHGLTKFSTKLKGWGGGGGGWGGCWLKALLVASVGFGAERVLQWPWEKGDRTPLSGWAGTGGSKLTWCGT